ncbi:MAG: LuxR C-terminal-related transcriptional regulator [Acidaminococcaceae bacterium]
MVESVQGKGVVAASLGALGLAAVGIWSDLLGHYSGFALASTGIQSIANARLFFLIGFTVAAVVSIGIPRLSKFQTLLLQALLPVLGCVGTVLFGLAYGQDIVSSDVLAIIGLLFCGASYYGMATIFFCELAKVQCFSTAVWAVAAGLFLKTLLGGMVGLHVSSDVQFVLAIVLPLLALGCLKLIRKLSDARYLLYYQSHGEATKAGVRNLLYFFIAASVIVAALRGFSHLGLWGEGYLGSSVVSFAGYIIVGLSLAALTYGALVRNSSKQMLQRYQPAFLVLIGGFLVYVAQNQLPGVESWETLLSGVFVATELFGHLLLRAVVFTAIRTTTVPGWRFQGMSDAAYGVTSIVWALLLQNAIVSVQLLVMVALFFSMMAAIRPLSKRPSEAEIPESKLGEFATQNEVKNTDECSLTSCDALANSWSDVNERMLEFYKALSRDFGLSPRETDVFLFLTQGRSRPYICEALFLSDGTVKTHITHIYRKFNVHSRQELLTAIQEAQTQQEAIGDTGRRL